MAGPGEVDHRDLDRDMSTLVLVSCCLISTCWTPRLPMWEDSATMRGSWTSLSSKSSDAATKSGRFVFKRMQSHYFFYLFLFLHTPGSKYSLHTTRTLCSLTREGAVLLIGPISKAVNRGETLMMILYSTRTAVSRGQ